MKRINLIARLGLFTLILSVGTLAALAAGETKGLALADLSGTSVHAIATANGGDVLYAALMGERETAGIYRSEDGGDTWYRVSSGPNMPVSALAARPSGDEVLYAGTAGGPASDTTNLWFSHDGGRTWQEPRFGLPSTPDGLLSDITALAIAPEEQEVFYVGTDGQGVYRFETKVENYGYELIGGVSLYNAHVKQLVVSPDGLVYAVTNDGLFASEGGAWQQLPLPEMAASLAISPHDPQTLYAGGVSTGIYRSTDAGQSWARINSGLDLPPGTSLRITALAVDEDNPQHVIAATTYGLGNQFTPGSVHESKDSGSSWTRLADADSVVTQLTLSQGAVYATGEGGLVRYGQPLASAPDANAARSRTGLASLGRLGNPSGVQVLILALTIGLAGLALVGRTEWVLKNNEI